LLERSYLAGRRPHRRTLLTSTRHHRAKLRWADGKGLGPAMSATEIHSSRANPANVYRICTGSCTDISRPAGPSEASMEARNQLARPGRPRLPRGDSKRLGLTRKGLAQGEASLGAS